MKLSDLFLSDLKNSEFKGDIATEKSVAVVYSTDNSIYEIEPDGVIFPASQKDVELIFKLLRQEKYRQIKITARGGGTSTNGQSINYGLIVDYSRHMNKIISIDAKNFCAEVEPGVILDVLNKELEKFNLYFPPNISPSNRATIGGMVNTDACGKGSCTHGRTSDNIEDLSLHLLGEENVVSSKSGAEGLNSRLASILEKAKNLYSSKHLARTATGYNIEKSFSDGVLDLNYLISGSEGTLALVSKIKVRLKKLPAKKRAVLLRYKNFDAALADAQNVIALAPAAIETVDENVIRLARNDIIWQDVAHLIGEASDTSINILEFTYDDLSSFENHFDALKQQLESGNYLFENYFIINDKTEIANIWNLRKQGVGLLGAMKGKRRPLPFVEDTIVPPTELAKYISGFRKILKKYDVTYGMFGHVDAGCLHVRPALNMRQEKDRELIRKISNEVCELLLQHRGIIWGEHGKGFRSEYNEKFLGSEVQGIFTEIKKLFDPFDQLNCGKIAAVNQAIPAIDAVTTRGQFDENISAKMHDEFENILSCNGNALCFNLDAASAMCPSYKATGDRRYSPKGRAVLFKEWVRKNSNLPSIRENVVGSFKSKILNLFSKGLNDEIYESFSKCLGCKACNTQCPIKVSIPDAKAYFLSHYFAKNFCKPQDYLIGNIEKILLVFGKFPRVFNCLTQNKITKFLARKIFAVTDIPNLNPNPNRQFLYVETLPNRRLSGVETIGRSFLRWLNPAAGTLRWFRLRSTDGLGLGGYRRSETDGLGLEKSGKTVYLLREAYTNYYQSNELHSAFQLLSKLGFDVRFTEVFENGKALHAKGFLNRFRKIVAKNIDYLSGLEGTLLSIDPSIALSYRDEYSRFNDKKISVLYFAEFLQQIEFTKTANHDQKYHLILHCSEQTNIAKISDIWCEIFKKFNVTLNVIKTGCCGMSGSFGSEAQNFNDSKIIFENNWQQQLEKLAQDSKNVVMLSGSSCQSQVERFSAVTTHNPLVVLNQILSC